MPRGTDRYDEARHQGRLWTPALLRGVGKLAMWWDYSDLNTISASGADITQVRDKSGNGRNGAPQAVATREPDFLVNGWAGPTRSLPALSYDGSNDNMHVSSSIAYSAGNGMSVHAVINNTGSATNRTIMGGPVGAPELSLTTTHQVSMVRSNQAVIASSSAVLPTGRALAGWDAATNRSDLWVNGARETNATNPAFSANALDFGLNGVTGTNQFVSLMGEILVCNFLLSLREGYLVSGYYGWKWGVVLSAVNPFKNRPPLIGD